MIQAGCLQFSSHHVRPSTDSSLISSHSGRDPTVTESQRGRTAHTPMKWREKYQTLTETGSGAVQPLSWVLEANLSLMF